MKKNIKECAVFMLVSGAMKLLFLLLIVGGFYIFLHARQTSAIETAMESPVANAPELCLYPGEETHLDRVSDCHSTDEAVVTFVDGRVTAVSEGEAYIVYSSHNAICTYHVIVSDSYRDAISVGNRKFRKKDIQNIQDSLSEMLDGQSDSAPTDGMSEEQHAQYEYNRAMFEQYN